MAKHLSSHKIGDEVGPTGNSSKFAMVFHCSAYASARGWLSMFKRWGIAQLLAVFWATSSMQYCAAPATAAEQPEGGKQTVIRGVIVEKHDLLSDANDPSSPQTPDIEWSHAFTISLSGKNQVSEVWNNTRLSVAAGAASAEEGVRSPREPRTMDRLATRRARSSGISSDRKNCSEYCRVNTI